MASSAQASTMSVAKLVHQVIDQRKNSKDDGGTLNLRNGGIPDTLPDEVIDLIKDEVSRLDLAQNQMFYLDSEFKKLSRLRYLDIRSNKFREFPEVLFNLTSLEILDISRNKIRILPRKISQLKSLKILSIERNRIEVLPTSISEMAELRALTVTRNPLIFPPPEICNYDANLDEMETWLSQLKEYMRSKAAAYDGNESGLITRSRSTSASSLNHGHTDGGSDEEMETGSLLDRRRRAFGRSYSMDTNTPTAPFYPPSSRSESPYSTISSSSSSQFVVPLAPPPIPTKNLHRTNGLQRSNRLHTATIMERSRSHSEASQKPIARPRRRAESTQRHRPGASTNAVPDERPRVKQHTRGISHDSGTQDDEDSAWGGGFRASPTHEMTQGFGAYFRRLSIMPASVRVSLSSIKVVEAARGILFALSQIHQAAQQYVGLCGDTALSRNINRVLYNAKTHVGNLIDSLEAHEGKGEGADVLPVIEGCNACVGAFKHVINILLQHIEQLADRADVRLTRTFILLIYGAAVEMQNSWAGLRPSLPLGETRPTLPSPIPNTPGGNIAKTSSPQANRLKTIIGAPPNITLPPTPTSALKPDLPKLPSEFQPPPTPSGDLDTDEPIFEKIQTATTTALGVLAHISEEVAKLHVPGSNPAGKDLPSATMAKLKELGAYAVSTGDVTKRLKGRVALVKDRREFVERRKFWEDTNTFVKAVIAIAQLARTVSIDFKFPEHINQGLSALTRSTKEAALLLSGSSFRSMGEDPTIPNNTQQPPQGPPPMGPPSQPVPKPVVIAQIPSSGIGATSLSSLLSPMNISPMTISPNYTPGGGGMASPSIAAFPSSQNTAGLNKFDATIVQMRAQGSQGGEQGSGVKSPPPPPIVSIPLPRE